MPEFVFPPLEIAPIQLLTYRLAEQAVQVHPEANLDAPASGVDLSVGFERHAEDGAVWLRLMVSFNEVEPAGVADDERNRHVRGHLLVVGEFEWIADDELPEEERAQLIAVNGASVLYGIARVHARQLTDPLPGAPLLLPTLSFRNVADALAAHEASDEDDGAWAGEG